MRAWVLAAACVVAACTGESPSALDSAQNASDQSDGPAEGHVLSCEDFASLTRAALAERFGAENLSVQTLPGAEGDIYEATVLFDNDPVNRIEIVWNESGDGPSSISVTDAGTQWRGSEGYTIGTSLADVEGMNGRVFQLYGFGWDYGGWASNWNGGALHYAPTCRAQMRFDPRGAEDVNAMGDREFHSSDSAIRAADPVISSFGLVFPTPQ